VTSQRKHRMLLGRDHRVAVKGKACERMSKSEGTRSGIAVHGGGVVAPLSGPQQAKKARMKWRIVGCSLKHQRTI